MSTPNFDVVIVGGGPGGSTAASFLARAGKRVLLLEKERFPRFRVGESLLPYGNDVLEELGVLQQIEAAGFLPKYGADFCTGDRARHLRFWFDRHLGPRYQRSFQVERAKFDQLLLEHSRALGADAREDARVTSLERVAPDEIRVAWESAAATHTATAAWVIDASGRDAFAGTALGIKRVSTLPTRRVAIYGHFSGVFRSAGRAANHITIVRMDSGWVWFIPLDAEKTSVGLVLPSAELRASGLSPEQIFDKAVSEHEELRVRLAESARLGSLRTTGDYSYRHESFATDRVLLVGDAAGFLDPIFSTGVLLALKSGRRAAQLILAAGSSPLSRSAQRAYTSEVERWLTVYSRMISAFYDRAGFEIFIHPAPVLQLPRAIAHVVGGCTELPLGLRLRLAAFYAVCRFQRWVRLAPRLPSPAS